MRHVLLSVLPGFCLGLAYLHTGISDTCACSVALLCSMVQLNSLRGDYWYLACVEVSGT